MDIEKIKEACKMKSIKDNREYKVHFDHPLAVSKFLKLRF